MKSTHQLDVGKQKSMYATPKISKFTRDNCEFIKAIPRIGRPINFFAEK
jgi:hypothetical protein